MTGRGIVFGPLFPTWTMSRPREGMTGYLKSWMPTVSSTYDGCGIWARWPSAPDPELMGHGFVSTLPDAVHNPW